MTTAPMVYTVDLPRPQYIVWCGGVAERITQHEEEAEHEAKMLTKRHGTPAQIETVPAEYEGAAALAWREGKTIRLPEPMFRLPTGGHRADHD